MSPQAVLVVEDDEDVRDAVAYVLGSAGYEVREASNGRDALDVIVARGLPDLILLDMNMAIMNGWEFAGELKRRGLRTCPIVVLTAAHDAQRSAEEIGAVAFIGKPFELEALVNAVRRHIDGRARGGTSPTP